MQVRIRENMFGYEIVGKNGTREQIIASGFRDKNRAIDYARLFVFDTDLHKKYAFTKTQVEILKEVRDKVNEEYCSWLMFVENVMGDKDGLKNLLSLIDNKTGVQDIVNNYI